MHMSHKTLLATLAAAGLAIAFSVSADVRTDSAGGYDLNHDIVRDISLRGHDVVITAPDSSEALITPAGRLSIRGRDVPVTGDERALLKQYSAGILDIQQRGIAIGHRAVEMVGGMMGTLVADLFTYGGDDKKMDRDMKAKAEPLKGEARALCSEVQQERAVQERLTAELPEFRPYAVIDTDPQDDCHIDDNDED